VPRGWEFSRGRGIPEWVVIHTIPHFLANHPPLVRLRSDRSGFIIRLVKSLTFFQHQRFPFPTPKK
jgi:hypothetical protein